MIAGVTTRAVLDLLFDVKTPCYTTPDCTKLYTSLPSPTAVCSYANCEQLGKLIHGIHIIHYTVLPTAGSRNNAMCSGRSCLLTDLDIYVATRIIGTWVASKKHRDCPSCFKQVVKVRGSSTSDSSA